MKTQASCDMLYIGRFIRISNISIGSIIMSLVLLAQAAGRQEWKKFSVRPTFSTPESQAAVVFSL